LIVLSQDPLAKSPFCKTTRQLTSSENPFIVIFNGVSFFSDNKEASVIFSTLTLQQ